MAPNAKGEQHGQDLSARHLFPEYGPETDTYSKAALARRVQIKSQISKGHLCAWLGNRLRLKQFIRQQAVTYRAGTGLYGYPRAST